MTSDKKTLPADNPEPTAANADARYKMLFDQLRDAVVVFHILDNGERGPFIDVNRAACDRYGYTREEMLALTVNDLDAPEFKTEVPPVTERYKTEATKIFEVLHVDRHGTRLPGEVTAHSFLLDGRPAVIGIVRDISAQKAAQDKLNLACREMESRVRQRTRDLERNYEELQSANQRLQQEMGERLQAEAELKESEHRYRFLVDNLKEGIWKSDAEGRTTFVNNRMAELLGISPDELLDKPIFNYMDDEAAACCARHLELRRQGLSEQYELDLTTLDGRSLTVQISASPVMDENGVFQGSLAVLGDITEQTKAARALEESERRFRSIVHGSPMGMHFYQLDDQGRMILIDANPAADAITGINTADLFGLPMEKAFPSLAGTEIARRYREAAEHGTSWHTEEFEYSDNALSGVYDVNVFQTSPGSMAVMFKDVTARRDAEIERRKSLETMQAVLDSMPLRIYAADLETYDLLFADKSLRDRFGENIIGKKCWEVFRQAESRCPECKVDDICESGSHAWERDRDDRHYLNMGTIVKWLDGRPAKLQMTTDITELTKARRAADAAEGRYRKLVTDTVIGIFRATMKGELEDANPALARIFGYDTPEDMLADVYDTVKLYVEPDSKKEVQDKIARSGNELVQHDACMRRRDGRKIWVRHFTRIIKGENNAPDHVEGFLMDITSLKTLEHHLREEKNRAEAASRAKSAFLANMSHEIRTPLNGVMGMLQLLRLAGSSEERERYVETALASGRNLLALISDILDLSRVEAGKTAFTDSRFELENVLNSISDTFKQAAENKGLRLGWSIRPGTPPVLSGDAGRLRQILFNLVGNGIKFTDSGSVFVDVCRVGTTPDNRARLLFSVADTGLGIPDHLLRDIFEPFTQADDSHTRKFQGAGLGLSIVRRLVEVMGGNLSLENMPDAGTVFHFTLPFEVVHEQPRRDAAPEILPGFHPRIGPKKLLLAEDDRVNQLTAQTFLEKIGHTVIAANNGRETLELLAREPFDALLLDVQMPEMDGIQVARTIRENPDGNLPADIPILGVTAHVMAGDHSRFLDAGMNLCLPKPMELPELVECLDRLFESEQQPRP